MTEPTDLRARYRVRATLWTAAAVLLGVLALADLAREGGVGGSRLLFLLLTAGAALTYWSRLRQRS